VFVTTQLYYVQRPNAGERDIPSFVQRGIIGGFLGRLGMTVRLKLQAVRGVERPIGSK
jgi:hypothetical protein